MTPAVRGGSSFTINTGSADQRSLTTRISDPSVLPIQTSGSYHTMSVAENCLQPLCLDQVLTLYDSSLQALSVTHPGWHDNVNSTNQLHKTSADV